MSPPQPRDGEKNDDADEGSPQSPAAKRPRCSCYYDDRQMELLKEMRSMLQGQNEKLEFMYRENQELREKVSCLTADISRLDDYLQQSPAPGMLSEQKFSIRRRLQFVNSCSNDKFSTRKIEADDESPLKVAIYDHNKKIITHEPFSSMRVQIVAIHGEFDDDHKGQWTEEDFHNNIVTGRPGKQHLLSGKLYFRLQDGVGSLNSATFRDNSSFVPSKRFKLGVMAADERISERIQEGITESFAVKDIRGYSTKKNLNPSSGDPVYKLSRIAMNGDRHKLLEQNGIKTVEELLCFHSTNVKGLRKILGKISDQDLDTIIKHAYKCKPRPEIYSRCIQEWNASHEDEPIYGSNGSYYRKGSCSIQGQFDFQVKHQQVSSGYNGLSSGVSSGNVPTKFELQPNTSDQNVMPHGNGLSPGNSVDEADFMSSLRMWEEDLLADLRDDSYTGFPCREFSGDAVEENRGRSPASEAGSTSYRAPAAPRPGTPRPAAPGRAAGPLLPTSDLLACTLAIKP